EGAVYAVALSQARIRAHYYAGLPTSGSDFGYQKRFTVPSEQLTDALSLGVNVASGNLTLRTHDIHFEGVAGFDLDVGRVYNSLVERWGTLGAGWQFDTGADVRLDLRDDGAIGYDAPDGARYV